jgi:glyoxylase-like metal-dependent hydrolase (beta-lactamase superfamily II)
MVYYTCKDENGEEVPAYCYASDYRNGEPFLPIYDKNNSGVYGWSDFNECCRIFDVIRNKITELKLKPEQILLTHGHLDHIGAVRELIDLYQIPVYGPHEDDLFLINAIEKQSHMLRLPPAGEFKPEKFAKDRETINVAGEDFLVLHCPGHTPGHVVYYATESKFCLTGDVIFQSSIGRTDFPRGNYDDLISSIRNKIFSLPDDTILIPGHGPYTMVSEEKKYNPYLNGFDA